MYTAQHGEGSKFSNYFYNKISYAIVLKVTVVSS